MVTNEVSRDVGAESLRRQGVPLPWRTSRTMPEAWVYLLRCRDGSLYTGWTVDLERRLARHRSGVASRYTASRLPVELALAIPMSDRTAARREEARIKRLARPAKLALLTGTTSDEARAAAVGTVTSRLSSQDACDGPSS
jgi:putative endonuclease